MAVKKNNKSSAKKTSKKSSKKISKEVKDTTKEIKQTPKEVKSTSKEVKQNKKAEKKDILTIIALSVLIIVIILFAIFSKGNEPVITNTDSLTNVDTTPVDTTPLEDLIVDDTPDLTEEELMEEVAQLQTKINSDIMSQQLAVFEGWYSELGLDKAQMDSCFADNNYANMDLEIENAKIMLKITEDIQLANIVGINGTPGLMVNGFKVDGFREYDDLSEIIDMALTESEKNNTLTFMDKNVTDFNANLDNPAKLYVVYNKDYNFTTAAVDEILSVLGQEPYNDFFDAFFEEVEVVKTDYREVSGHLEDVLYGLKINSLPLFYLEGDVESLLDENSSETFNTFFVELPNKGYLLYTPQNQFLDYSFFNSEEDYVYGDDTAPVTIYVFDDYDCPYCEKLDKETLPLVIDNYVKSGKVNIVMKDFVVHQAQALFPAVFSRCAQKQGKYWETHSKLFEDRSVFGGALVESIFAKYEAEISQLQKQYEKVVQ